MFFIFAYLGCLWLMVGIVSYYHNNNNNNNNTLYKMINNRINNNLSIFKYGLLYKRDISDLSDIMYIVNYITLKYNVPSRLCNMVNFLKDEDYFVKDGVALYYNSNMIIIYKKDELIDLINTTTDSINTWEWIDSNTLSQSDKDSGNTQLLAIIDSGNTLSQSDKDSGNTLSQSDKDSGNIPQQKNTIKQLSYIYENMNINNSVIPNIINLLNGILYYNFNNNVLDYDYTIFPLKISNSLKISSEENSSSE